MRARQIAGTREELLDLAEDVDPERDHIRGAEDAPVTLLEYGDYECPYCGQAEVGRSASCSTRSATTCATSGATCRSTTCTRTRRWPPRRPRRRPRRARSGRCTTGCSTTRTSSTPRDLTRYAEELGLDIDRFWDDLAAREHAPRIAEDVAAPTRAAWPGTPSFFINGRRHQGAYDIESLSEAVRAARKRARLREKAAAHAEA